MELTNKKFLIAGVIVLVALIAGGVYYRWTETPEQLFTLNFPAYSAIMGAIILFSAIAVFLFFKTRQGIEEVKEQISYAVAPRSIQLSTSVEELVNLSVELWRMEQRIKKAVGKLEDVHKKSIEHSIEKFKEFLSRYDIQVRDHTGEKYNEGLNLDVLSVEVDNALNSPIVKETVEPTVICKGQVVRKAKVVIEQNG